MPRKVGRHVKTGENSRPIIGEDSTPAQTCLIDGEVVCCDERGLAAFNLLRRRRNEADVFLYAL